MFLQNEHLLFFPVDAIID